MYDASNRKDVQRAEKASVRHETSRLAFLRAAMDTAEGRIFFLDFLERCHIFASSFNHNPLVSAFAEGERNIGLQYYNEIITASPDRFVQMMKERTDGGRPDTDSPGPGSSGERPDSEGLGRDAPSSTEFDPYAEPDPE